MLTTRWLSLRLLAQEVLWASCQGMKSKPLLEQNSELCLLESLFFSATSLSCCRNWLAQPPTTRETDLTSAPSGWKENAKGGKNVRTDTRNLVIPTIPSLSRTSRTATTASTTQWRRSCWSVHRQCPTWSPQRTSTLPLSIAEAWTRTLPRLTSRMPSTPLANFAISPWYQNRRIKLYWKVEICLKI